MTRNSILKRWECWWFSGVLGGAVFVAVLAISLQQR